MSEIYGVCPICGGCIVQDEWPHECRYPKCTCSKKLKKYEPDPDPEDILPSIQ